MEARNVKMVSLVNYCDKLKSYLLKATIQKVRKLTKEITSIIGNIQFIQAKGKTEEGEATSSPIIDITKWNKKQDKRFKPTLSSNCQNTTVQNRTVMLDKTIKSKLYTMQHNAL